MRAEIWSFAVVVLGCGARSAPTTSEGPSSDADADTDSDADSDSPSDGGSAADPDPPPGGPCGASSCAADLTCCGDPPYGAHHCSDLGWESEDCGRCGHACGELEFCEDGECLCYEGASSHLALCDGICTDLWWTREHCGSCGSACASLQACVRGSCVDGDGTTCGRYGGGCDVDHSTCCGGTCVNLRRTADHCGTCDSACASGAHCIDAECGTGK